MAGQSRAGWLGLGLTMDVSGALTSRRDPAFQASELHGHSVHQRAALRRLPPTGMVGLLLICNVPRLTCALSQRPVPDPRKSCKVSARVAVPVERDLEFPAQSRQRSASALKRSLEYLEMQDRYQESFSFSFFFSPLLCVFGDFGSIRRMQCPPVLGLCGSPPAASGGFFAGPSLGLPRAFLCSSCFLYLDGAGCSRAEDLSTADQAEGEAGRTGAEMQPDPAAQPGPGGQPPAAGGSSEADTRNQDAACSSSNGNGCRDGVNRRQH
ncbi:uncharacterized protein M6G45_009112 isoform 3-T3 [Spheniscus humboldti]